MNDGMLHVSPVSFCGQCFLSMPSIDELDDRLSYETDQASVSADVCWFQILSVGLYWSREMAEGREDEEDGLRPTYRTTAL